MFGSSRGNYAPLGDEAHANRGPKLGHTYVVQRLIPEGRTIFRVILGCTFALGIIALLKTTGTTERLQKFAPAGYGCDQSKNYDCSQCPSSIEETKDQPTDERWKFDWQRDGAKFGLSESQCNAAFPGLWKDTELALEKRKGANVTMQDLDDSMEGEGAIRCMIYDGQLYVIDTNKVHDPMFFHRAMATLSALYRAIVAMPDPKTLPNVEFIMNIHDKTDFAYETAPGGPNRPVWAYTRLAKQDKVWLMPDFGFYSWPEGHIGTPAEVTMRIDEIEARLDFQDKIEKVFWRGAVNTEPQIRGALVEKTKNKPWADVQEIHWGDQENEKKYLVPITDHCRWMFLAHTEGHSYSGRLKYLQACRSVIIAHKLVWIQPQNYMMIPSGENQNFVEVERDFSNLEAAVMQLIENPQKAKQIADNQVKTFKERYLTPAAEACYWRKLIRQWSLIGPVPQFKSEDGKWRGMPFETYAMMKQTAY